jgi:hypothetical protein
LTGRAFAVASERVTELFSQALIATQFATVLQVVWRAIWQFLDAILFGGLLARNRMAPRPRSSPPIRLSLVLAAAAAAVPSDS